MGAIAGFRGPEEGDHEPRNLASSDATCRLNVLGCGLGLPIHDHQSESGYIDSDGKHVRRGQERDTAFFFEGSPQSVEQSRLSRSGNVAGEFNDGIVGQLSPQRVVLRQMLQASRNVVPRDRDGASELSEAVVIGDNSPV